MISLKSDFPGCRIQNIRKRDRRLKNAHVDCSVSIGSERSHSDEVFYA